MLTRSPQFDAALIAGAEVVVQATITQAGVPVLDLDLLPGAKINLSDTVSSRRVFTGQVADYDGTLSPHLPTDPLAPYTSELVVKTGLVLPEPSIYSVPYGTKYLESIPLGVFRLLTTTDESTGLITITGPDRAAVVAFAGDEIPYVIPAGSPLGSAIGGYLASKYPALPYLPDGAANSVTTTSTVVFAPGGSNDPFTNIRMLAVQYGRECYIDNLGNCILRPIPVPSLWPVSWIYTPGAANLATSGTHIMDTSNTVNVVVVTAGGTGVATPVTATSEITDPTSPIYPDPAGFGRRPLFLQSSQAQTESDCLVAGQALLNQQVGADDSVHFTAVPNPCHEPSDVVSYASNLLGLQQLLVLSAWSLPVDLLSAVAYTTRTAGTQAETVLEDVLNSTL